MDYLAPEVGIDPNRDTSVYTNAVDVWSIGCITHELLTQVLPFRGITVLVRYCSCPEFPREFMLTKSVSQKGNRVCRAHASLPMGAPDSGERSIGLRVASTREWRGGRVENG